MLGPLDIGVIDTEGLFDNWGFVFVAMTLKGFGSALCIGGEPAVRLIEWC